MSNIFFKAQKELLPVLRAGDTARCERTVAERLATLPQSPFHIAIGLAITNTPARSPPTSTVSFARKRPASRLDRLTRR